jgi:peptide/nickel transport system substrate-binding protein
MHEPEVDALLDEGRATTDQAKRKEIYDKLQVLLADVKVPYLWLYSADLIDISQTYVKGYQQHPTSFLYGMAQTWLDK